MPLSNPSKEQQLLCLRADKKQNPHPPERAAALPRISVTSYLPVLSVSLEC